MLACFDLSGKVAFVTGASLGLGRAFARALARSGASLVLVARRRKLLEDAAEEMRSYGADCICACADIGDEAQVEAAVEAAMNRFGRIDILVNNAAAGCIEKPIEENTAEEWDRMVHTNLVGPFIVAKAVGRQMICQRSGKIINIASIGGTVFNRINWPGAYETSKEGIKTLTKCLDANWNRYNINVNAIEPGYFMTDVNKRFYDEHPELLSTVGQHIPCGRNGEPDELGPLCVLLASDGASYMHGSVVRVDGGRTYW